MPLLVSRVVKTKVPQSGSNRQENGLALMAAKDHGDLTSDFLASHGSTPKVQGSTLPTSQAMMTIQIAG